MMKAFRKGFTLIELMVCLAVIGILVSLLMPAVQSAREAARRSSCKSNLRQVALALHNYHELHQILPSGSLYGPTPDLSGWGWGAMVLPNLEQSALYQQINFETWDGVAVNGNSVIASSIPVFRCPSEVGPIHITATFSSDGTRTVATGNYAGVRGMLDRVSKVRFGDVTDGLSQTLCIGERIFHDVTLLGGVPYTSSWVGELATDRDFFPGLVPHMSTSSSITINSPSSPAAFSSYHAGGANFAMGDGSVQFLNENIDGRIYQALGTSGGGEIVSF